MIYLKEKIFSTISKVYPHAVEMQKDNGKFVNTNGKYNVYGQYIGYYFAFMYTYLTVKSCI